MWCLPRPLNRTILRKWTLVSMMNFQSALKGIYIGHSIGNYIGHYITFLNKLLIRVAFFAGYEFVTLMKFISSPEQRNVFFFSLIVLSNQLLSPHL